MPPSGLPRWVDVAASVTGLVLLSPVLVAAAVVIKIDSPGPVLFTQERVGRDGRIFELVKLRTFYVNSRPDPVWAPLESHDSRITRVGNWLRRTSVDEIPNLWNVLRGHMALVGPRPTIPAQVAEYTLFQLRRLEVRPGITGLAQVTGRAALDWPERIRIDVEYVERRSWAMDLWILGRTIGQVVSQRGVDEA